MKKYIILSLFLFSSCVVASPLIDTKQNIIGSDFCNLFDCKLVSSGAYAPNEPKLTGFKQYVYELSSGANTVTIVRNKYNVIVLALFEWTGTDAFNAISGLHSYSVKKYIKYFTGIENTKPYLDYCVDNVDYGADDGSTIYINQGKYIVKCFTTLRPEYAFSLAILPK